MYSSDEEDALLFLLLEKEENYRKKKKWVHPINEERYLYGEFHTLMSQFRKDEKRFYIYFRMTIACFDDQLNMLRMILEPEDGLTIALRYLATGDTFYTIGHSFRVRFSTARKIVRKKCLERFVKIWKIYSCLNLQRRCGKYLQKVLWIHGNFLTV